LNVLGPNQGNYIVLDCSSIAWPGPTQQPGSPTAAWEGPSILRRRCWRPDGWS